MVAAAKMRKRLVSKRQTFVSAIIGVVTLLIVFALVALSITPVKYDLAVGEVSPATITARSDIKDTVTTQRAIEEARNSVDAMYTKDESVSAAVQSGMSGVFDGMVAVTDKLRKAFIDASVENATYGTSRELIENSYDPTKVDWRSVLKEEDLADIRAMLGNTAISDGAIYALAALNEAAVLNVKEDVRSIVSAHLNNGIQKEYLQSEKDAIEREIEATYTDRDLAELAFLPVDMHLAANQLYDEAATQKARDDAAAEVKDVMYKQSQTVVVEGDVLTEAQMKVLADLGVVGGGGADFMLYFGMFLFILLLFGAYGVYLYQFESEILSETRKLLILAVLTVVIAAIAVPLVRLDSRIIPVFFGTMLASVLVTQRSALALNVFLAFIVGAICSWNTGLLSVTMLQTLMLTIIGGSVSVFALHRPGHRASLIFSGLLAGGVNVVVAILMNLIGSVETVMDKLLLDSVYALGSGLLSGVLAIGTLPIWEAIFRVSTPTKLLELSNPNHPLMKRLTVEAPGTYHHSILVANLAESGADALGANALLCRVGAYYHDVGKLKKPKYFKENQKGENPHDKLSPKESVKVITEHLTYGMELAQKFKLPRDVQQVMMQHHGDTQIAYFLHKAREQGMQVDESAFRYKGIKPTTKEAAVVMLADSVEAAVRSMDEPDKEQVRDMINKIIRAKYNDGQLDDCPLNRRDLNTLAKAFLSTYDGALHERVKYPGQEN